MKGAHRQLHTIHAEQIGDGNKVLALPLAIDAFPSRRAMEDMPVFPDLQPRRSGKVQLRSLIGDEQAR